MNERRDVLTGRRYPQDGRRALPIVGRWCKCAHNHSVSSAGKTTNYCPSCPCASFVKASA